MSIIAVGIGAGLVSALLFAVVITGSLLGVLLSYIAPLPVLIAALGWNHRSGLIATAAGGLATAIAFRPEAGLAFAIGSALPGWWLAYLTLLGRPTATGMEWYPLGRLLLWLAGIASVVTLSGVMALGSGSYSDYRDTLRQALEGVLRLQGAAPAPDAGASTTMLDVLITVVPFIAAGVFVAVYALNLWLAAKVVLVSGRLPRSWPSISSTAMPRSALALLFAAIAASFAPGLLGVGGLALAGALVMAFAFQGLGLLHEASRGRAGRAALLGVVYALVLVVGHTVLPLLALAGIVDTALDLRNRFGSGGAGPLHPST